MSKSGYKNIVGDRVESLTKVKVKEIHCSSLIQRFSHFTIEGNQASHAWFTFDKSMLIAPNHFLLLVPRNVFQEHPHPYFPRDEKEASQLCSSLDCISAFFEGCNLCLSPVTGKLSWYPRCFKDDGAQPHCDSGQPYQHPQTQPVWPHGLVRFEFSQ